MDQRYLFHSFFIHFHKIFLDLKKSVLCSTEFHKFEHKIKCKLLCCFKLKKTIEGVEFLLLSSQMYIVPLMSYPQG